MESLEIIFLTGAMTVLIAVFSRISLARFIKSFLLVAFLSSVLMTYMHEYKRVQAEYKVTMANTPWECINEIDELGHWWYFWMSVKSFFKGFRGDYCSKYRMAFLMEPYAIYKVTLMKAISKVLTEFCLEPFEHIGTAFGKFFTNVFSELPWILWIPAYLLLTIIIIAVSIFVIAIAVIILLMLYNNITGRLRGNSCFQSGFANTGSQESAWNQKQTAMTEYQNFPQPLQYHSSRYRKHDNPVQDLPVGSPYPPHNHYFTDAVPHQAHSQLSSDMWASGWCERYQRAGNTSSSVPYIKGWTKPKRVPSQSKETMAKVKRNPSLQTRLGEDPVVHYDEDANLILFFIDEKLATLRGFLSDTELGEFVASTITLMKATVKELSFSIEGLEVTARRDISSKLDLFEDCLADLGVYFEKTEARILSIITVTQIKDMMKKLRVGIQKIQDDDMMQCETLGNASNHMM